MATRTLDEVEGLNRLNTNAKAAILKAYDIARYETLTQGAVQQPSVNLQVQPPLPPVVPQAREPAKLNKTIRDVTILHLLQGILMEKNSVAVRALSRLGLDITKTLERIVKPRSTVAAKVKVSDEFNRVVYGAYFEASKLNHVYVGTEHLLLSIFNQRQNQFVKELEHGGINYDMLKNVIVGMGSYHPGIFSSMPSQDEEGEGALEYFTRDMNQMAMEGKFLPIFGRQDEIQRLIHILSRKNKNNPVLIGDAGVGKTAIVEGFVQKIISGEVPDALADYKVIQLDLATILAGAKIRGDVEERLLAILDELKSDKNKVVFIDEIHMIIGAGTAGSGGGMDIANLLKPHLTSGDIKVIGATTFDEYQKYFEEDNALTRRFQPITVNEISKEDSINLLKYVKGNYEAFHGIHISQDAIEEAVNSSARYITDRFLPDKALDVIDETAAKIKLSQKSILQSSELTRKIEKVIKEKTLALELANYKKAAQKRIEEKKLQEILNKERRKLSKNRKKLTINAEDVKAVISQITGIPSSTMNKSDLENLKSLEQFFGGRIIGQEAALKSVTASLKRARVGLMDQNRPLASFLFLGPTGVGKTETAKVIAKFLFGDEKAILQVNMSEFMEQHSVSKIIGSPPGYVGYSEGGHITEKVRRKPYTVVLFDEIEKAHPDTLNVLLQILEEGEIRDSRGRNVNFRNTIIIMTSNIGAEKIADDAVLGFDLTVPEDQKKESKKDKVQEGEGESEKDKAYKDMKKKLLVELKYQMRPEFLNRIDEISIFRGLDKKDARKITKLLIDELNHRLTQFNLQVDLSVKAINFITEQGFSQEYGARNLRRKIQELIETELSEMMLDNKVKPGGRVQSVKIDVKDDELTFKV